ncbi:MULTISPECIES: hypothetical protein [Paraburkholderia]|uniref:Uncharacterized protein n=1 Tax=Paraburkholderia madseniana TaxID=2599607 RepID=A0AAP5ERL2_9BURK|nr:MULTISPECIES: hypothetical protein [Paraburkholderia]MCX4150453.1 hypothetical protein [Paraburkholderia madseniana]MDN7153386.1 hypothetical protein [Paraburkholderia sp. WS6]MDQ6412268.1 hypothetical protein [Paraburkholderia madseniana]
MANTTTNKTAGLERITTATGDSTIACLRCTNVEGGLHRIGDQEAYNHKVHCGDDALARRAGV